MQYVCPVCQQEVAPGEAVCHSCGFKLQGSTLKFEHINFDEDGAAEESRKLPSVTLRVVRGPSTGVAFKLTDDEMTVGRAPQCSIFLNDMTVSRAHATIEREGDAYVIRDNNSFNGVWVNNENVEAKTLSPGDIIQIGAFCLRYEEE